MKRTILMKAAIAVAVVSASAVLSPVRAQDAVAGDSEIALPAAPKSEKFFFPLVRCIRVEKGTVQVLVPGGKDWALAKEGHFYPLGSTIRALGGEGFSPRATFGFGPNATLSVSNVTEFATAPIKIGESARRLILKSGRLSLNLPRTLKDGLFSVSAPFFVCSNLAGESVFDYNKTGDGDEAVVRVVTGSMTLDGRHYKIARMGAANQVRIRTTGDDLFTSLRGESGDYKVLLNQGLVIEKDFETGAVKDVPKTLEFSLSPQCAIKIFRATSVVGGRTVVSMMTFNSAGEMKNRCAFAEDRSNVNSGELVVATVVNESERAAKKDTEAAAEAVETVEVKPIAEPATEKKDESKETSSEN